MMDIEGRKTECKKILIAGDIMLDVYHFGRVDRISPEAPVPVFLETGKEKYVPGGGANVAVNIAKIGIKTELCAVVGSDKNGSYLLKLLQENGIETRTIAIDNNRRTTTKLRYIGPNNQQILRADTEDIILVSYDILEKAFKTIKEHISEYGLFLLSDYSKGFLTEEITQFFITLGNQYRIPIVIDVKEKNYKKYINATLLKPNRRELAELTGFSVNTKEEAVDAAIWLCQKVSSKYVLVTLGENGMILVGKQGLLREVKSFAQEVYDVTGAGDTSIAYLASEIVKGKDITEAMIIANYAAGVQVSKVGTCIVYPYEVCVAMQKDWRLEKGKQLDFYDKREGLFALKQKQASGCKIVFTNGCFDILHGGHVSYLREAKQLGDILVVGINSDESVKRLKGETRPINTLSDRLLLLSALDFVDYVIPFKEDTPEKLIAEVLPDILVKGGDYQVNEIAGSDIVTKNGGEVRVLPFTDGKSTTAIIEKIKKGL